MNRGFYRRLQAEKSDKREVLEEPWITFSLDIYDFGEDPDVVTRTLGLTPTSSGKRGEFRTMSNGQLSPRPRKNPVWEITFSLRDDAPMSDRLRTIAALTRQSDGFDKLPSGTRVVLMATVIWGGQNPDFVVPADCMAEFARIGATLEWSRIRITGDMRTKYHKHRDRKSRWAGA